jgi:hypothetical protein
MATSGDIIIKSVKMCKCAHYKIVCVCVCKCAH